MTVQSHQLKTKTNKTFKLVTIVDGAESLYLKRRHLLVYLPQVLTAMPVNWSSFGSFKVSEDIFENCKAFFFELFRLYFLEVKALT